MKCGIILAVCVSLCYAGPAMDGPSMPGMGLRMPVEMTMTRMRRDAPLDTKLNNTVVAPELKPINDTKIKSEPHLISKRDTATTMAEPAKMEMTRMRRELEKKIEPAANTTTTTTAEKPLKVVRLAADATKKVEDPLKITTREVVDATKKVEDPLKITTREAADATKKVEDPLKITTREVVDAKIKIEDPLKVARSPTEEKSEGELKIARSPIEEKSEGELKSVKRREAAPLKNDTLPIKPIDGAKPILSKLDAPIKAEGEKSDLKAVKSRETDAAILDDKMAKRALAEEPKKDDVKIDDKKPANETLKPNGELIVANKKDSLTKPKRDAPIETPKKLDAPILEGEKLLKDGVKKDDKNSSLPLLTSAKTGRSRRSSYGATRVSYAVREAPVVRMSEYSPPAPPPPPPPPPARIEAPTRAAYGSRVPQARAEYSAPVVRSTVASYEAPAIVKSSYEAPAPVVRSTAATYEAPAIVRSSYEAPAPVVRSTAPTYEAPAVVRSSYVESTQAPIRISTDSYQQTRESPRYRRSSGMKMGHQKSSRSAMKGPMKRKIGPGMMVKM